MCKGPPDFFVGKQFPLKKSVSSHFQGSFSWITCIWEGKLSGIDAGTAIKLTAHHCELAYMGRNHFFPLFLKENHQWKGQHKQTLRKRVTLTIKIQQRWLMDQNLIVGILQI